MSLCASELGKRGCLAEKARSLKSRPFPSNTRDILVSGVLLVKPGKGFRMLKSVLGMGTRARYCGALQKEKRILQSGWVLMLSEEAC